MYSFESLLTNNNITYIFNKLIEFKKNNNYDIYKLYLSQLENEEHDFEIKFFEENINIIQVIHYFNKDCNLYVKFPGFFTRSDSYDYLLFESSIEMFIKNSAEILNSFYCYIIDNINENNFKDIILQLKKIQKNDFSKLIAECFYKINFDRITEVDRSFLHNYLLIYYNYINSVIICNNNNISQKIYDEIKKNNIIVLYKKTIFS